MKWHAFILAAVLAALAHGQSARLGSLGRDSLVVTNAAPAYKEVPELVSCDWHDGTVLLKWYEDEGLWHTITRLNQFSMRSLLYGDGRWTYLPNSSPTSYTNSVPIFGLPPTLTLYRDEDSVTLTRTNEVWATNRYPVAYMDDVSKAADDATNYTDWVVGNLDIPDPDLSDYAKLYAVEAVSNKVETTSAIVNSWESYWGATNVELRVTNYYGNTTGALPRLQIREFRDGHWTNVWDEIDKFIACKAEILHEVAQSNATLLAEADRKYAPKAWGSHTDKGTTNVIPNSVYMTSPETYFGGGTEFQRVAVGSGAVSVLVDRGALAKTTGEPGTFRFQDAGGTNYFGFVKSDSYTIGCRNDGISVGAGNAITLRYDVIMSGEDVPVVYWKSKLEDPTPWAQLNNPDGTAADGAPYVVTWLQDGGSYYATVNCGGSPSGFFVAETSVAGDVVWETNMKARLGGGIECTNTATHVNGVIRPSYNGSTVTWEWSAR